MMTQDNLLTKGLSSYFDSWQIIKKWETVDKHFLATVKVKNKKYIFKSPYPYTPSAYYSRSFYSLESTAKYLELCHQRGLSVIPFLGNKVGTHITKITKNRFAYIMPYFEHNA